jgi:hypothetical protein
MVIRAVEHTFNGTTTPYTSYDSTKTVYGKWIDQQIVPGDTVSSAGPCPTAIINFGGGTNTNFIISNVLDVGGNTHLIVGASPNASATTVVALMAYNTSTQKSKIWGTITITPPNSGGNLYIPRAVQLFRYTHSNGTVAVSGTAVTGTSTTFSASKIANGRIGFGSTDPTQITRWYAGFSVGGDTSLTLSAADSTLSYPAGTPYVIEEYRLYLALSISGNAVGGFFVVKGLFPETFQVTTKAIAASGTDSQQACYWLADLLVAQTNNGPVGFYLSSTWSGTSQDAYVVNTDSTTQMRVYKYNVRAALSDVGGGTTGKSAVAFLFKTGAQTIPTANISQEGLVGATPSHGVGSGVASLYVCSQAPRIYRIPIASISDSSTTFIANTIADSPPGGGANNSYALSTALVSIRYDSSLDRFIVVPNTSGRVYVTKFYGEANPSDRSLIGNNGSAVSGVNTGAEYLVAKDSYPMVTSSPRNIYWSEDGLLYALRLSSAIANSMLYVIPIGADWEFAGDGFSNPPRLITPALSTPGCTRFRRFGTQHLSMNGKGTYGVVPEPFRAYYRTSGITDNTGSWVKIDSTGDLSGASPAESIQFMFEFRIMGSNTTSPRIYGLTCSYEDDFVESHYLFSQKWSSIELGRLAWKFNTAFGTTVPTLYLSVLDAVTGTILIEDTTVAAAYGTFEKSTDGGVTWGSYNSSDKVNDRTYIRYTPSVLPTSRMIIPRLSD